nr:uncharacterized protein LOC112210780 [Halyomorpha halys]
MSALRDLRRLWGERKQSAVADPDPEAPRPSLPLLQVWPSQDSPKPAEGSTFVFEQAGPHDSGIESVQASPSGAPVPTERPSLCAALLHPDHARRRPSSPSLDEPDPSPSSSTASSLTSVRFPDRRRSSIARYSLLDALDLEYALFRAAARGSVGPYSLSGSVHKLTFTQSLAFPALARGLANKRSYSNQRPLDPGDSGLNVFAKIVTALVLMLVSVMVFGVVYKFVRT